MKNVKKIQCEQKIYTLNDILIALSLREGHLKMCDKKLRQT